MKLLLSLDYELFFGKKTGSAENCLLRPINALLDVLDRYHQKLSLFVDVGFLCLLEEESKQYPHLGAQYDTIKKQLIQLQENGHDLQLHIHPHWEDSYYDGERWRIKSNHYRLHDFSQEDISRIVSKYKATLVKLVGDDVFAFRAGGWCLQPFDVIAEALRQESIWLDSTVFPHGVSEVQNRGYDFRGVPEKAVYRFNSDPLQEENNGYFVEVPISSCTVSPFFFYKMIAAKKMKGNQYKPFGDGTAMAQSFQYYLTRLTRMTRSVASIDGLKAGFLQKAFTQNKKKIQGNIFNVMGHPKSLTPYSLLQLDNFLKNNKELEPITYQDLKEYRV